MGEREKLDFFLFVVLISQDAVEEKEKDGFNDDEDRQEKTLTRKEGVYKKLKRVCWGHRRGVTQTVLPNYCCNCGG